MSTRITLKPQTAARVKQLVERGPHFSRQPASGALARGVTWVKVTGSPDGDGWHPAVTSLDTDGVWADGTTAVLVAAADFSELVTGGRYLCTRTGDTDANVARFRTVGGTGTITVEGPGGTPTYPDTHTVTISNYFTYTNPSPGTVRLSGPSTGSDRVTFYGMRDGKLTLELTHTAPDGTQTTETHQIPGCLPATCCSASTLTLATTPASSHGTPSLPVSFAATPSSGVGTLTYLWDFDDGTTSTLQNPSHTFTTSGMFEVTCTVTESGTDGCGRTATHTQWVYVYTDPCQCGDGSIKWPISFAWQMTGGTGDFSGINGNWTAYLWQDADGNCFWNGDLDGSPHWRVKVEYVGTYSLRATFTDGSGNQIVYHSGAFLTPCGAFTGWVEDSSLGTGTTPTFVSDTVTADGACGDSCLPPITTPCCGEPVPRELSLSITGCACVAGALPLTYDAAGPNGAGWYTSAINPCNPGGHSLYFRLFCDDLGSGNLWYLVEYCDGVNYTGGAVSADNCTTAGFQVSGSVASSLVCCTASTFVVTVA